MAETPPALATTRLSVRWLRKLSLFGLLCLGFGIYGLYDATIAYPERGENDASYRLMEYLRAAEASHGLSLDLGPPAGVSPSQHRRDLRARAETLQQAAEGEGASARDAQASLAMLAWLDSLAVLGRLSAERVSADLTSAPPREALSTLEAEWKNRSQPKPLSFYDIPVQWLFVIVGFGGALWIGVHMARVASKKYTWEAEAMRLGLPGGEAITPGDVVEFDKRKWDKFLFFLKIRPDHPQLGGREIKLDLYQYVPLEEWAVAMHRSARPEDYEDQPDARTQVPGEHSQELSAGVEHDGGPI